MALIGLFGDFGIKEFNMEKWKAIKNYEGIYEVSDQGRVRSLDRIVEAIVNDKLIKRHRMGKLIKSNFNSAKRLTVGLHCEGDVETRSVHRLVIETFGGPCPEGCECAHNNGDPNDNRFENLRWDSRSGNQRDRIIHGTSNRGSVHSSSKLVEPQVLEIRDLITKGLAYRHIAVMYNVSVGTISGINNGHTWGWLKGIVA